MMLRILSPGPLSLLQDLGRQGHQHIGVSPGGPMDEHAFLWANRLLDNTLNDAQIEITMGQFRAEFTAEITFALTGADMGAKLNDKPIVPWQSYHAQPGDTIALRGARYGTRCYLAVKGGFTSDPILHSRTTVVRDQLGGLDQHGSALKAGDEVPYITQQDDAPLRHVPSQFVPEYGPNIELEVIPSYQFDRFAPEQRERFFNHDYTVTTNCDRMGYRLSGESIQCQEQKLISEGIALGAIQIPADGQPIVLMRDRQTIGGYPKMGCVCAKDLSKLAQSQPGTTVRFVEKSLEQATQERRLELQFFNHYVSRNQRTTV
ncbi:5-oxoprolinase subunit C family protein [Vibrio nitrifigilis]|uniref:Biotin-dependent carboxyltransferase n=2 Tax=Vibrio nitrifigilis TaxID=2789781 RepID=A0ABS0G9I5_9VIBR|nr:biotin-dependent carboxyltransferase [Vibrio nitrifigilis]